MKENNSLMENEWGSVPGTEEVTDGNTQKAKLKDSGGEENLDGHMTIDGNLQTTTENLQTMLSNNQEFHGKKATTSNSMEQNKVNIDDMLETNPETMGSWNANDMHAKDDTIRETMKHQGNTVLLILSLYPHELPKFSSEQHPLAAFISIVNKAFQDTGAHYPVLGYYEYPHSVFVLRCDK
jgi:hypothetical protein